MSVTLLITNGDVTVERLAAAGIKAPSCPGATRSTTAPCRRAAQTNSPRSAAHRDVVRVEVWLEHDLYDQLQLLQILDRLAALGRTDRVWLVQAADYLGPMDEGRIRSLAPRAAPVTPAQFNLARQGWAAFTAPTPQQLVQLLASHLDPLPWLGSAL